MEQGRGIIKAWARQHEPIIPVLQRLRQADHQVEVSLGSEQNSVKGRGREGERKREHSNKRYVWGAGGGAEGLHTCAYTLENKGSTFGEHISSANQDVL